MSSRHKTINHELATVVELASVTDDGFTDVSVMTVGPARGHGMRVDDKTVGQFMSLVLGKSMPSYLTHKGATDDDGSPQDRLGQEVGIFSGFYRMGDKIVAKNFKFLDSWKAENPKLHAKIVELAKDYADQLGISPVVKYVKAWVTKDGAEVVDNGQSVPANLQEETPAMRVRKIFSLDFVKSPATNTGLFDELIDEPDPQPPESMADKTDKETIATLTEQLTTKSGEVVTLQAAHQTKVSELTTAHTAALTERDGKITALNADIKTANGKVIELETKVGLIEKQRDEAVKHDMRLAGAPALHIALEAKEGSTLPEPAEAVNDRWAQYVTLCDEQKDSSGRVIGHKETDKAKRFREKHLPAGTR